ncbi:hypothetical protein FXN65_11525 [Metapseudomonas lalkuanensis]|uniref:Uncharacterized protein n=1 Tax=Metapseudomonas lalkuanensis TaxID=2604832 RepID=A0A5J6QJI2_9GAMM|nr:hypothetical protein [Pseudomonas lalkuanensis]QEY62674.1 hypothetical protein FXN65_11525 [Pseudomonas lalkuanensis]UCO96098.1 hypothetical protein LF844_15530 [Pseudomonas lalkuanensis]
MRPSHSPKLQVLHQPSGKNPRSVERIAIFMVIGMFLLGVYGQYSGRGPGSAPAQSRPATTPVFEFQRLSANPAERTASSGQQRRQERRDGQEQQTRVQL